MNPFAVGIAKAPRPGGKVEPRSYVPHKPHPKQAAFLALDCNEALYGGAAAGGKSEALLMAALEYVHEPSYAALLLRRTYQDLALPGAIMDRASEYLSGSDATWNGTDKRWTFPSGATLSFGYLDTERDRFRYASAEFQFIGFDELTQFPEGWYRFLFSRLRKRASAENIPLRMRAASNPGGLGHEWVRRRFVAGVPGSPPFIGALIDDNPSVDRASYLESLAKLDPTTRKQLLEGVWVRDSGGLVYAHYSSACDVTEAPVAPKGITSRVLALDFGFTDATAFVVLGWCAHDRTVYVLRSFKVRGKTPSEIAEMIRELEGATGFDAIVGDLGGLGKGYAEEARRRFQIPIEPAEKRNKRGYQDLLNGAFAGGQLKIVRPQNLALIEELAELPWDKDRAKEADGFDNHLCDALLYGWRRCAAYAEEAEVLATKRGTPEWHAAAEARAVEEHDAAKGREWWEASPRYEDE